jgi:hypothetical protein
MGPGLRVIADWCDEGGLAEVVPANIRSARARAGRELIAYCPPVYFKPYDPIGLRPAAARAGQALLQGGDTTLGQAELRGLMTLAFQDGGDNSVSALFQVSKEASWTLRAMSGGYAREAGSVEAMDGPYRVVGEALSSFAVVLTGVLQEHDEGRPNRFTPDGRPYLSMMPVRVPRRRERESA